MTKKSCEKWLLDCFLVFMFLFCRERERKKEKRVEVEKIGFISVSKTLLDTHVSSSLNSCNSFQRRDEKVVVVVVVEDTQTHYIRLECHKYWWKWLLFIANSLFFPLQHPLQLLLTDFWLTKWIAIILWDTRASGDWQVLQSKTGIERSNKMTTEERSFSRTLWG